MGRDCRQSGDTRHMPEPGAANSMSPNRAVLLTLLVVLAGCTGVNPGGDTDDATTGLPSDTTELPTGTTERPTKTTDQSTDAGTPGRTTEPHTGVGTSHAPEHFSVRAGAEVQNVTVTLAPNGDTETHHLDAGSQLDLTREIHDRGHGTTVVVERGNETVFDETIAGYEFYRLAVYENETSVQQGVV